MPRVWKRAEADKPIFDALPTLARDTFLSDDELLVKMGGVTTRATLNAALGPTARGKVTFDADGRYWRKVYKIDEEPRCIYFVPAVQNRALALETYPVDVEPPFPRPEAKFQCKRKQPPKAPRKPASTTAQSGEKRPTAARPRMDTTPGEKVVRVEPVDDAERLVPDDTVVDLDDIAPAPPPPRPVTRRNLTVLEERAEDAQATRDHAVAALDACVAAYAALHDGQERRLRSSFSRGGARRRHQQRRRARLTSPTNRSSSTACRRSATRRSALEAVAAPTTYHQTTGRGCRLARGRRRRHFWPCPATRPTQAPRRSSPRPL